MTSRPSTPSRITATGTVISASGHLMAVTLEAGTAAGLIVLRDGGAGGTIIAELSTAANGNSAILTGIDVTFTTDLHATISGAGTSAMVYTRE